MPRKPKVQRTPEEKWQIVLEGLKSGNVAETCRKYEIAPTLYYRWKDEVEEGAKAALGGRSAAARPDVEQEKRIKQLERALGRSHLQIEILKNVLGVRGDERVERGQRATGSDFEDCGRRCPVEVPVGGQREPRVGSGAI
jgi:putative transposase